MKIHALLLVSLASCEGPGAGVDVYDGAVIQFVDHEGNNILLKENPDFAVDDLRLYYYNQENQYVMRFKGNLGDPYFIGFDPESGSVIIYQIIGDDDGNVITDKKYATYLDFGNGDVDTLEAGGYKKHGRTGVTDLWYNGKQIFDNGLRVEPSDLPGIVFSVVK